MTLGERLRIETVVGIARLLRVPIRVRDEFWLGTYALQHLVPGGLAVDGGPVETGLQFDDCNSIIGVGPLADEVPNGRGGASQFS